MPPSRSVRGRPYWHTALAQLMAVALKNRDKGLAKIKQILVMEFHTEVIAGMENRLASISTIVRMGPLLGLLGTVASMIGAFGRIGGSEKVNPDGPGRRHQPGPLGHRLGPPDRHADDDLGNDIHAKLRRLRDRPSASSRISSKSSKQAERRKPQARAPHARGRCGRSCRGSERSSVGDDRASHGANRVRTG